MAKLSDLHGISFFEPLFIVPESHVPIGTLVNVLVDLLLAAALCLDPRRHLKVQNAWNALIRIHSRDFPDRWHFANIRRLMHRLRHALLCVIILHGRNDLRRILPTHQVIKVALVGLLTVPLFAHLLDFVRIQLHLFGKVALALPRPPVMLVVHSLLLRALIQNLVQVTHLLGSLLPTVGLVVSMPDIEHAWRLRNQPYLLRFQLPHTIINRHDISLRTVALTAPFNLLVEVFHQTSALILIMAAVLLIRWHVR